MDGQQETAVLEATQDEGVVEEEMVMPASVVATTEEAEEPEADTPVSEETTTEEPETPEEQQPSEVSKPEIDLSQYIRKDAMRKFQSATDKQIKVMRTEARLANKALRSRQALDPLSDDVTKLTPEEEEYNAFLDKADKDDQALAQALKQDEYNETVASIGRMIEASGADLGTADTNPVLRAAVTLLQTGQMDAAVSLVQEEIKRTTTKPTTQVEPTQTPVLDKKAAAKAAGAAVVDGLTARATVLSDDEFMDAVAEGKDLTADDLKRIDKIINNL